MILTHPLIFLDGIKESGDRRDDFGKNRAAVADGRSLRIHPDDSPRPANQRVCLLTAAIREVVWSSGSGSRTREFTRFLTAC
jgi:hypothetical protein